MLGKMGSWFQAVKNSMEMSKDDDFKKLLSHPKVKDLLKDKEFLSAMQAQNAAKIISHPRFSELLQDPELLEVIESINLKFKKS